MSAKSPFKDHKNALPAGTMIAEKYRIVRPIARGGFGDVYEAEQPALSRRVAIKIQRDGLDVEGDPNYLQRFLQEASAAAGLQHPNVVSVHDFGREGDRLFLVMEYLEGQTVAQALDESAPLSVPRAIHIAKQVCRALRAAHKKGIIHRDIKPANILMVERDEDRNFVQVLDFGLVRDVQATEDLTKEGKFLGTPRYMSPEHFGKARADARSDVYSLGVVLYRMLSNAVPFDGNMLQIMSGHLHHPPSPIHEQPSGGHIPQRLADAVMRCLSKDPEDRFQSMAKLLATLESIEVEMGVNASSVHSEITRIDSAAVKVLAGSMKRKDGSRAPLVIAALVILGIGGFLAQQLAAPEPVQSTKSPTGAPVNEPLLVTPKPTTTAIGLHVTSSPPGAEVFAGAKLLGKTPLQTTWELPFGASQDAQQIELRLSGHQTYTEAVTPVDGKLVLDASLARVAPKAADKPATPDPGLGDGYKEDPY